MSEILTGATSDMENAEFLSCLAAKGESDEELLGMLDMMREVSIRVNVDPESLIDMCGTGGDRLNTFNVSTAASFVVAAAGGRVAKHGNRSSSGACGSADIFESLGCDMNQGPSDAARTLERHNICFMFAQRFHPAMRHVAAARRTMKRRTVFNLLGPLSNPACVEGQLVGVSSQAYLERLPRVLQRQGRNRIMAVRSDDGMDELSTSARNKICLLRDGVITGGTVDPEDLGLHRSSLADLQVSDRAQAVESFVTVLRGTACRAMIETAALNAAGGLVVSGVSDTLDDAVQTALDAIDSGRAFRTLEGFVADVGDISILREMGR